MTIDYKLEKSNKQKGEEGKYQILEIFEDGVKRTCGVYFNKKDAVESLKKLKGN